MLEKITPSENLQKNMIYDKIEFPIFVVHTDNIELIDGILWIDNQVLDDLNVEGSTLGKRRLQSPMKSMYPLKYMLNDIKEYLIHQGKHYIDTKGFFWTKEKTKTVPLIYHKIVRVEQKDIVSKLWLSNCPSPFTLARPLHKNFSWAGVLYLKEDDRVIYEFTEKRKKKTWRKI